MFDVLSTPIATLPDLIGHPAIAAIAGRMTRLGLGHLASGRSLDTLSGGERQRLKLVKHLDESTTDVIIDEPTAGLHIHDIETMTGLLDELVAAHRTIVLVEHSLHVIAHADWVIDLGPGAGADGGRILFAGPPKELLDQPTPTGRHLAHGTSWDSTTS